MSIFFFFKLECSVYLGECRTELSKANETITTLCQQLESEKMQSESANESLNHLRVILND